MYKVVKEGKGGIVARIVADSVNTNGNRITTFELEYHRYIHGEIMTHRLFSRNAMSSRAVPVKKMIEQVENSPATPIHWGAAQSGMQADEECNNPVEKVLTHLLPNPLYGKEVSRSNNVGAWDFAKRCAVTSAKAFQEAGYHKQIVNRLLEPFQMMKVVLTATEFDNFFWLRCDKDAQPEIQALSRLMHEAMEENEPELLKEGEWHTPYVTHYRCPEYENLFYYLDDEDQTDLSAEEAVAISSSCCAQVSYRNIDNSFDKAMNVYERLGVGGEGKVHASPFEHISTPMKWFEFDYNDPDLEPEKGVTHTDIDQNFWSGNFKGWIQHRQLLDNHTCYKYEK